MVELSLGAAAGLLRRDRYRHLAELNGLDCNAPPVARRAFGDAAEPEVVMLVEDWPDVRMCS